MDGKEEAGAVAEVAVGVEVEVARKGQLLVLV